MNGLKNASVFDLVQGSCLMSVSGFIAFLIPTTVLESIKIQGVPETVLKNEAWRRSKIEEFLNLFNLFEGKSMILAWNMIDKLKN